MFVRSPNGAGPSSSSRCPIGCSERWRTRWATTTTRQRTSSAAITTSRSTRSENELALALADLGRVRSRLGDTADACRRLEQALDIFERLGTHEEPDRIRRELAQLTV